MAKLLIQRCRVYIVKNLGDVNSILDHLESDEIISRHESEKIKAEATSNDRARKLLDILHDKAANKKGIHSFKKALLAEKYEDIIKHINDEEEKLRTSDDTLANDTFYQRDSSADMSLIIDNLTTCNTNINSTTNQIKDVSKRYSFIRERMPYKSECTGQLKRNNGCQKMKSDATDTLTIEIQKRNQIKANCNNEITHTSTSPMRVERKTKTLPVEKEPQRETEVGLTFVPCQQLNDSLNRKKSKALKSVHRSPSYNESIHITDANRELFSPFLRGKMRHSFEQSFQIFKGKEADIDSPKFKPRHETLLHDTCTQNDRYKEETVSILTQVPLNSFFTDDKMKNQQAHSNDKKTRPDSSMPAVIVNDTNATQRSCTQHRNGQNGVKKSVSSSTLRNLSAKEVIESKIASSASSSNLSTNDSLTVNSNKQFTCGNDRKVRLVSPISTIDLSRPTGDLRTNYEIQQTYTNDGKPWNINSSIGETTKNTPSKPNDVTTRIVSTRDHGGPSFPVLPVLKINLSDGDTTTKNDIQRVPSRDKISKVISPVTLLNVGLEHEIRRTDKQKECDNKGTQLMREYQRNDLHVDKFYIVTMDNQSKQELKNLPNSLNNDSNKTLTQPEAIITNNYFVNYVLCRVEKCFCSKIRLSNIKVSATIEKEVFV